jgi:aconitate hydratase
LSFHPLTDTITDANGNPVKLTPPAKAPEVPADGFTGLRFGFEAPAADGSKVSVIVPDDSERLQLLTPFTALDTAAYTDMPVLIKTVGKTTTDHISPAGPWLKFRGHLDKISDNMLTGANNAWSGERGLTHNIFTGETGVSVPAVARDYKARNVKWVVVGDENYGEGSSREHAAMSPRFLNGGIVIVRSFARIHETNLKKQGILPLRFENTADYERIAQNDKMTFVDLDKLAVGQPVKATVIHQNGQTETLSFVHTMNEEQIAWFKAGGALNILKTKEAVKA